MNFKRFFSLLLALCMLFSFTACGVDQETVDLALDVAEILLEQSTETDIQENPDTELAPDASEPPPNSPTVPADEHVPAAEEAAPDSCDDATSKDSASNTEDGIANTEEPALTEDHAPDTAPDIDPDGVYTTRDDVALYLYTYGVLPVNFITKKEARDLGWPGGDLEPYAPGMCIGGDTFGNREGLLPQEQGRTYRECDIDTLGASSRGAKRLVFSNDGLIYYTEDHYESFVLLYGDEIQ